MNEPRDSRLLTGWDAGDDPRLETIALLQEEVARLEAEIAARDEALLHPAAADHDAAAGELDGAHRRRVEGLIAELAGRDETVTLLLEQTQLFEEAAVAQREEWEQLHRWVEEVERRVEGRDVGADTLRAQRDEALASADSVRREWDSDRRGWTTSRDELEREVRHLRDLLDARQGGDESTALREVEEENRRLRAACAELQRVASPPVDLDEWHRRVTELEAEREQSRAALRSADDERHRERQEHEAEVAALRSRLARESLDGSSRETTVRGPAPRPPERPESLDADERIRAFRQHLKDLHQREADERARLTFAARLSRLWKSTGPSAG